MSDPHAPQGPRQPHSPDSAERAWDLSAPGRPGDPSEGPASPSGYQGPTYSTPSYDRPGSAGEGPGPAQEAGAPAGGSAWSPVGEQRGGDQAWAPGSTPGASAEQGSYGTSEQSPAQDPYAPTVGGEPSAGASYAPQAGTGSLAGGGGAWSQPSADPYAQQGQSQPSADPYAQQGQSQPSADPYAQQAQSQPSASPYGQQAWSQPSADPYGQQAQSQPSASPYGQQAWSQPSADPYAQQAQSQPSADPYAQQAQSQPSANPYGQQWSSPGYPPQGQPGPYPGAMTGTGPVPGQAPVRPDEEKLWGTLTHVGMIITGFIGPLIVYVMYKDRSQWIRANAAQSLNFSILVSIVYVVSFVLMFVGIGVITYFAAWICAIIFGILAAMAANRGEFYKYPLNVSWVK